MSILYNRRIAAVVLVLCIAGTILLGGGRSLRSARSDCAQLFYDGTSDEGSIADDLHARCEAGHNLITVALRYMDEDTETVADLSAALETLEDAATVEEAGTANEAVTLAAEQLHRALDSASLSDYDRELVRGQYAEMTSRNLTISHDGYNTEAASFNELLCGFPTSLIAKIAGVQPLELFN